MAAAGILLIKTLIQVNIKRGIVFADIQYCFRVKCLKHPETATYVYRYPQNRFPFLTISVGRILSKSKI